MLCLLLKLHPLNSLRPKTASLAKPVVSSRNADIPFHVCSLMTSSAGLNLGGVENGRGGGLFVADKYKKNLQFYS